MRCRGLPCPFPAWGGRTGCHVLRSGLGQWFQGPGWRIMEGRFVVGHWGGQMAVPGCHSGSIGMYLGRVLKGGWGKFFFGH